MANEKKGRTRRNESSLPDAGGRSDASGGSDSQQQSNKGVGVGAPGASRRKLGRRQGGAARSGVDREEAVATLRTRKTSDGGQLRGRSAGKSRNAGGRMGGEQKARGARTAGDRTGVKAALGRGNADGTKGQTSERSSNGSRTAGRAPKGRGRQTGRPAQRTRSGARKAGKKK